MNCTARLNENEMDERLLLSPSYLGNNLGCNEDKGQVASCIDVADRIPLQLLGELSRKLPPRYSEGGFELQVTSSSSVC